MAGYKAISSFFNILKDKIKCDDFFVNVNPVTFESPESFYIYFLGRPSTTGLSFGVLAFHCNISFNSIIQLNF